MNSRSQVKKKLNCKESTLKEYFTKRLERLASEILDITKIDDQSLRLNKTYFNLKEIVLDLVQDHRRQLEKSNGDTKLLCEFKKEQEEEVQDKRIFRQIFS
jgi:signal transduction histidine kinase